MDEVRLLRKLEYHEIDTCPTTNNLIPEAKRALLSQRNRNQLPHSEVVFEQTLTSECDFLGAERKEDSHLVLRKNGFQNSLPLESFM